MRYPVVTKKIAALSLLFLPCGFALGQGSSADKDSLARAAIQGYLNTRESFPFVTCRYTETVAQARSLEDALAGRFINAEISHRRLLIDGKRILHEEDGGPAGPQGAGDRGKKVVNGMIGTTVTFLPSGYLADGNTKFRHSPSMRSANVITPETASLGICVTLLRLGDPSDVYANGPDYLLRQCDAGKYTCWPEGYQHVDGKVLIKVGFGNANAQRMQDIFLDPERGFLPYRTTTYYVKNGQVYGHQILVRARKCSKGRWFPEHSVNVTLPQKEGGFFGVRETKVVELDVDVRPKRSEFTLDVPAGTQIHNPVQREYAFRLRKPETINVEDLPRLVEMCRKVAENPRMDTAVPHGGSHSWLNWLGVSAFAVLVVWLVVHFVRRRRFGLKGTVS